MADLDTKTRTTMVFGSPSNAVNDPRKAFREFWASKAAGRRISASGSAAGFGARAIGRREQVAALKNPVLNTARWWVKRSKPALP